MLATGGYNDQDILAYFTRPTRSVNHRAIAEIRTETKHKAVKAATSEQLQNFLTTWPHVDPQSGLSIDGDELLIKAREVMIAAVHVFNGAGLTFRAELFITTTIIAWTYLLHSWFRREGIDYWYENSKTKQGAVRYWELGKCLRHTRCPIPKGAIKNLDFLLELRHEIEHRSTSRIDDTIGAELQACCINFNDAVKKLFGAQYGLERRLPIALQFVTFGADQRAMLKKASAMPEHIETFLSAFEHGLTDEEYADPAYRMRIAFVPIVGNRASGSDMAVEFVKPDSDEARAVNQIFLKEVSKRRYTANQVLKLMRAEGYPRFSQQSHTNLWRELNAKDPARGLGCKGDYKNTWVWHDTWIKCVRKHCEENAEKYR